jgi:hypothetical protein
MVQYLTSFALFFEGFNGRDQSVGPHGLRWMVNVAPIYRTAVDKGIRVSWPSAEEEETKSPA